MRVTDYDRRAIAHDPDRALSRAKSDAALSTKIDEAWKDNRNAFLRSGERAKRRVQWRIERGVQQPMNAKINRATQTRQMNARRRQ